MYLRGLRLSLPNAGTLALALRGEPSQWPGGCFPFLLGQSYWEGRSNDVVLWQLSLQDRTRG